MGLASTIAKWSTGSYSVSRANVTVVNGLAVLGLPTTFNVTASVQPVNNKDLRDMPEGQSLEDTLVIWTTTELKLRTTTTAPDVVTIGGVLYRVTKATLFGILDLKYRCYLERITVP